MKPQLKIPKLWQEHIDNNTAFGKQIKSSLEKKQSEPVVETKSQPFKLGDTVKAALTKVGITEERVSNWLGAPCNCQERVDKLNALSKWATELLSGKQTMSPVKSAHKIVLPTRNIVGCIHEGTVDAFKEQVASKIPGVEFGQRPTSSSHRRVLDTLGHVDRLTAAVVAWNGGTDRPVDDVPYLKGTWSYAVTTCPQRMTTTLPTTLRSLTTAGFTEPDLYVDGILSPETIDASLLLPVNKVHERHNVKTFSHWHLTLLDMYSRNPWAQYYAIFQDDFICVRNLKEYLQSCPFPEKGYLNLFTFMENETTIAGKKGWVEAKRSSEGIQLGRGAVGLVFNHSSCETLLSSPHMITRRFDSLRRHHSLDGAIVQSMNEAGYSEFVHSPSLLQHIGEESSMGNRRHPKANTFPGEQFDALTLL